MLIEQYDLKLESPRCNPGSEHWFAYVETPADLSAVLPYLNATLQGAHYHADAQALIWRSEGRTVAFHPHRIAVSNLEDRDEARAEAERLVDLVNRTWQERDRIQPSVARAEPLKALEVFKLLPGQNCKACGKPTCFVFALHLVVGKAEIASCPVLFTDEQSPKRRRLLEMLKAAGVADI